MRTFLKTVSSIAAVLIVSVFIYSKIRQSNIQIASNQLPCSQPILYSLGSFDNRFNISQKLFLDDINQAAQVWDLALNKKLFQYDASSTVLTINLIYDDRQQTTATLDKIGTTIKSDRSSYNALEAKYNSLLDKYTQQKNSIGVDIDTYNQNKTYYEQQVNYWNSRGGAPQEQYRALTSAQTALNSEATQISQEQTSFNSLVGDINSLVQDLNQIAKKLDLNVKTYNSIGSSTSEMFDEGEYVEDSSSRYIDIYQFNNKDQLVRVLEHELGHALGLAHVDDPKAIMYYLNAGTNKDLTAADIAELRTVCSPI